MKVVYFKTKTLILSIFIIGISIISFVFYSNYYIDSAYATSNTDYTIFLACFNSGIPTGSCASSDFDGNGIIDINDFNIFLAVSAFDLNSDGLVEYTSPNSSDYLIFSACFNSGVPTGSCASSDFNGDGVINITDFNMFLAVSTYDLNSNGVIEYTTSTALPQWVEISGYTWNDTIGLVSLNCSNDNSCGVVDYKVEIDIANKNTVGGIGNIRGQASSVIGFISFNDTDLVGCPFSGTCFSQIVWSATSGEFQGWAVARGNDFISLTCQNDNSCSTSNYGVKIDNQTGNLSGFAWMNDPLVAGGPPIGWIDFSSATANFASAFGCYINDQYGRKIINFDGTNVGNSTLGSENLTISATSIDENIIPSSYYSVIIDTYDATHPDGESTESVFLKYISPSSIVYKTLSTPDLPNYATYGSFKVQDSLFIDADSAISNFYASYNDVADSYPYDSSIVPACIALDYTCPFNAATDRTIIGFTKTGDQFIRANGALNDSRTDIISKDINNNNLNIIPGVYNATVASYDEHSKNVENVAFNANEQFFLDLFSTSASVAISGTSLDIPDSKDFIITKVNSGDLFINTNVVGIQAQHSLYPNSAENTVTPICVALDKVSDPIPQSGTKSVTLIPTSQGASAGDVVSIGWYVTLATTGNISCNFTSTPTDSVWSSNDFDIPAPTSNNLLNGFSGVHNITIPGGGGGLIYNLGCEIDGAVFNEVATISVPPLCSDGIDNDGDTLVDAQGEPANVNGLWDRGCTDASDNSEAGEAICVVNNVCETIYGEGLFTCPLDCIQKSSFEQ